MSLRINDIAPNFTANTTKGSINFHDWIGNQWAILFSHPKDFTPVCTTELGYMAKIEADFTKRNTKLIGLSIDSVKSHLKWEKDIKETQNHAVNYPIIGNTEFLKISLCAFQSSALVGCSINSTPSFFNSIAFFIDSSTCQPQLASILKIASV